MRDPVPTRTRVSQLPGHPFEILCLAYRVLPTPLLFVLLAAICMIFAVPMRAQSGSITILVYDYVRFPPGTLREAEHYADKIVATAGLSVNWVHCLAAKSLSADAKAFCVTPAGRRRLRPCASFPVAIVTNPENMATPTFRFSSRCTTTPSRTPGITTTPTLKFPTFSVV